MKGKQPSKEKLVPGPPQQKALIIDLAALSAVVLERRRSITLAIIVVLVSIIAGFYLAAEPLDFDASIDQWRAQLELRADLFRTQLNEWLEATPTLRTHSKSDLGWMETSPLFEKDNMLNKNVTDEYNRLYYNENLTLEDLVPPSTKDHVFVLVRGLFTRWYPGYMSHTVNEFQRIGLNVVIAPVNSDVGVLKNAEILRDFLYNVTNGYAKKAVLMSHSKGGLDAAAMLSVYPETKASVVAHVSAQAPYGGATLVNDLMHTNARKQLALSVIESLLAGDKEALADLTYSARREFLEKYRYPIEEIPTISLATTASAMKTSLLRASVDYVTFRYGEKSDGCVSLKDAYIPGSKIVYLHDMDHFGPAYHGFPALDVYNPARMKLVLLKLALE